MRRFILLIMITFLLLANLLAGGKEWYDKARQLYQTKNYTRALDVIDKGLREVGKSKPLVYLKYTILEELERYDEALATVDEGIKKLVDKINAKIGIGKSAKDFSVELLTGVLRHFNLRKEELREAIAALLTEN